MKVTYPHMGHMALTIKALFNELGVEFILPPPITKRTLSLGVKHSPEFACLPMKINIGNFIEAAEQGADTIVMVGGCGPCRFGYYHQVQQEILSDLGLNLNMIVLEPPDKHIGEFLNRVKTLVNSRSWWQVIKAVRYAFIKCSAFDRIDLEASFLRCREKNRGDVDRISEAYIKAIDNCKSVKETKALLKEACSALNQIPLDKDASPIRIGLTGEIYALLEPFATGNLEKKLGRLGAQVHRSLYLSQWINEHLFMGLLPMETHKKARVLAKGYLTSTVGGHGQESVGAAVNYGLMNFDGVIQIAPLTCMPEIVAQSIMPRIEESYGIPILTLYLDEQTGAAGLDTRLEAFVDMLRQRRQSKLYSKGDRVQSL